MTARFSYYVVLASMRTGSNLLEERLNQMVGVTCLGELFNPAFAGHAHKDRQFGMTPAEIGADPNRTIAKVQNDTDGLSGFRLFRNHNRAAFDACLADPTCAKIVLRRNPVNSFVSLRIAEQTDQWRMQDVRRAKSAKITYDGAEFRSYLNETDEFYADIARGLKLSGQTAFQIDYDDLNDDAVLAGLAQFLGAHAPEQKKKVKIKKQNPDALDTKVSNFEEMLADLASLDPVGLLDAPSFEPTRGPDVKGYVLHPDIPLLFAPVAGGPTEAMRLWMLSLGDGGALLTGLNQRQVRAWKREHPGHRSVTLLRHPVARAWEAFRCHLVERGPRQFEVIHRKLAELHGLDIPTADRIADVALPDLRSAFLGFLEFAKLNLNGQTTIRVDASWASQTATVQGIYRFAPLHELVLEERVDEACARLAGDMGVQSSAGFGPGMETDVLASIYDAEIEKTARAAYLRDYVNFGFGDWSG